MKEISVPFIKGLFASIDNCSNIMEAGEKHPLTFAPWPMYPYKPQVHFSIAHNGNTLLLKYFVAEQAIRAAVSSINGPVWEDACVEAFIGFDETGYYNLEFNCTGTPLVGFGKDKWDRQLLNEKLIQQIKRYAKIYSNGAADIHWELTLQVPVAIFCYHSITTLRGMQCSANFYKCGDALPQPHFLSWCNVEAPEPDFHLSQFFGRLIFG